MNAQNKITPQELAEPVQLLELLEWISLHSQQVIDTAKEALLLADGAALFGAALANRVNAGTLEDWDRTPPKAEAGFASIHAARSLLESIREELAALQAAIGIQEENA